MLRVVIDTNILVSAVLSKTGTPAQVVDTWKAREFLLISSESAILEVQRVLQELHSTGKYAITDEQIAGLLHLLREDSVLVPAQSDVTGAIPADPSDELFLSIALDGEAQVIVSGDGHLLNLGTYQNIKIQTARQFLDSLKAEE
ncbi:MAG: putative toxin-antitoxin system toxin component, PIN family [Chloroflexota bacterium]